MATERSSQLLMSALPVELILRLYEELPSFEDALRLRATCRVLRGVWTSHRNPIINAITHNHLECYDHAREVLTLPRYGSVSIDQKDLSDRDLMNLSRHARRVEYFIQEVEQKLIPELKIDTLPPEKRSTIYEGSDTHPPTLTRTERLRVIRGCYQIWRFAMSHEDRVTLSPKLASMRPRQLLYFAELSEWARVIDFPQDRWDTFQIFKAKKVALYALYRDNYGCRPPKFQDIRRWGDPVRLFVIWDHSQHMLKNIICRRPTANLEWNPNGKVYEHLWDYEHGDELFLPEG